MDQHAKVLAVALAAFWSFPVMAQQANTSNQQSSPARTQAAAPAAAPEINTADMRPVDGELVNKLDTKTSKSGDRVVVKTAESVKTADGTVIPKGSKLVGQVTGVQAHDKTSPNSKMAIRFDHAELKSGKKVAIHSVIKSVAPPEGETASGAPEALPGNAMGPTGGGMRGDATAGGQAGSMAQPETGTGPVASNTNNGPAVGTVVARSGTVAIRTTAIPGVLLASNDNGQPFPNASGLLFGARQNIHLDGGTRVVLAVTTDGAGGGN